MGKNNKFEGFTLRNTATLSLDGSNQQVHQNHLNFIGYLRGWCYKHGHRADLSRLFDRECVMYTTLESGTFYPVITYEGRSLVFVFDGRNLYLKGFTGENGSYQLSLDEQKENYMLQENLEDLGFKSNYHAMNPGHDVGNTILGLQPFRKAFDCLWAHKGGKPDPKFRQSLVLICVYISEAARFQSVLDCTSTSLVDDDMSRLDKISQVSDVVTSWRFFSRAIMTHINYLMAGQKPPEFNNRGISKFSSIQDVLAEVRILFRDADPLVPPLNGDQCPFQKKNGAQYPVFASPVDPGPGDPKIEVSFIKPGVQSLYALNPQSGKKHQRKHQYGKRKIPTLEVDEAIQSARRKFYMGGGVGGPVVANVPPLFIEPWAPNLTVSKEQKEPPASCNGKMAIPKSVKTSPFSSQQKRNLSYSSSLVCMNGAKACGFRSVTGKGVRLCNLQLARAVNIQWEISDSWTRKLKISQEKNCPQYPVFASLVDPGLGDPKIEVSFSKHGVRSLYALNPQSGKKHQRKHQYSKRKRPTLEVVEAIQSARRKFYMSGGVGGPVVANVPLLFIEPWVPNLIVSKEQKEPPASSDGKLASPKSVKTSSFSSQQKRNLSYSSSHVCMNGAKPCGFRSAMGTIDMRCDISTISRTEQLKMSPSECNLLKWFNDDSHVYSGHAKMVGTRKSFLDIIKPRCSWLFCRVARFLH